MPRALDGDVRPAAFPVGWAFMPTRIQCATNGAGNSLSSACTNLHAHRGYSPLISRCNFFVNLPNTSSYERRSNCAASSSPSAFASSTYTHFARAR